MACSALGVGQKPALEAARRRATPSQLLQLVATVDYPAVLRPPPSDSHNLGVHVTNLEPLAPDLHRSRPPLRIGGGVADERPDILQRRIKVGLRAVGRHDAILSESDRPTPRVRQARSRVS